MPWIPLHPHPSDRGIRRYIWVGDSDPDCDGTDVLVTFDLDTGLKWWRCRHCPTEELWHDGSPDRVIAHARRHLTPWWTRLADWWRRR